ncbi:MAG: dephospho-CoA kinase [Clostridia bacterium]|nr:dephospho-CoA kinase [Clostridia bacterium]
MFDAIVFVSTPLDKRIERLTKSRNMSIEDALSRINSQVDEKEYERVATKIIVNDSSLEQLKRRTEEVFSALSQK